MNDEELIKCLEKSSKLDCTKCWQRGENCDGDDCEKVIAEKALALINRQQAEIEQLKSLCTSKDIIIKAQEAEIERLKGWQDLLKAEKHSLIKAEAIKEFAERLKEGIGFCDLPVEIVVDHIDSLVKEMAGEQNA